MHRLNVLLRFCEIEKERESHVTPIKIKTFRFYRLHFIRVIFSASDKKYMSIFPRGWCHNLYQLITLRAYITQGWTVHWILSDFYIWIKRCMESQPISDYYIEQWFLLYRIKMKMLLLNEKKRRNVFIRFNFIMEKSILLRIFSLWIALCAWEFFNVCFFAMVKNNVIQQINSLQDMYHLNAIDDSMQWLFIFFLFVWINCKNMEMLLMQENVKRKTSAQIQSAFSR